MSFGERISGWILGNPLGQGVHELGTQLLGTNRPPLVNRTVFVRIDAPANPRGVEPAALIDATIEIRIHVAIDFQAILVVAPAVEDVVPVGVHEPSQGHSVWRLDEPADLTVIFVRRKRAGGQLMGAGLSMSAARCTGCSFRASATGGDSAAAQYPQGREHYPRGRCDGPCCWTRRNHAKSSNHAKLLEHPVNQTASFRDTLIRMTEYGRRQRTT